MSKTVEEIGLIVGGIALAVVPGLQWAGLLVITSHAAVLSAMFGIGVSAALSGVGLALRPPLTSVGTANSVSFSNGIAKRRTIYGQFQVAGVLTYASFPPSQNQATTSQFLHLIYTLCSHEITSFDAVIVNGTIYNFGSDILEDSSLPSTPWQIHPAVSPTPNDFFWEHLLFEFDCGKPGNGAQPFPNLANADSAWTSACLQRGCAKVHVILRADTGWPALFPSGQVPNIQFLVTGKKLIDPRIVTAWAASSSYAKFTYTVDNNGVIWIQEATGTGTSGSLRPPFESFSASPGHTLTDNTCTWICSSWSIGAIYNGNTIGPVLLNARLVNADWVPSATYSTSTLGDTVIEAPLGYFQVLTTGGTTSSNHPTFATAVGATTSDGTATWTCLGRSTHAINPSNSALVVNDYLQDSDFGMGTSVASIDEASVIAAANVCEEQELIIWNPDNTVVYENLYSCNGMFDQSSDRGNVLAALCGSMAGFVVPPGDEWHVFAGAYITPTIALTDNDLRGAIRGDFRLSKRDVANSAKGTYIPAYLPASPAAAVSMNSVPGTWQSQSYPPYQLNGLAGKPNYLNSEDGGQIIWQDFNFEFTTSVWTAQRLAKIALMRLRFQETLTLPYKLTAFQLEAGDTFYFTHARWGIVGGVYEATECSVVQESGKDSSPIVGVDIVARQVDPSIYSFTPPSSSTNYGEYSPYGVTGQMSGVE